MDTWLVKDIQLDILKNKDIVSILRKTLVLAKKLNLSDLEILIKSELKWYDNKGKIPKYRIVYGNRIVWWNPYRGWILANIDDDKLFDLLTTIEMHESISVIEEFAQSWAAVSLPTEYMSKFMDISTEYKVQVDKTPFINIIEYLKNFILETCVNLEKEWINGNWISFSNEEMQVAKNIPSVTNIFYWEIKTNNLQISSDNSQQNIEVSALDIDEIKNFLSQLKAYNSQIKELPNGQEIQEKLDLLEQEIVKQSPSKWLIKGSLLFIKDALSWASWNLIATWVLGLLNNLLK